MSSPWLLGYPKVVRKVHVKFALSVRELLAFGTVRGRVAEGDAGKCRGFTKGLSLTDGSLVA